MRYEPPIIAVHDKQRPNDAKQKAYTILLQKLAFHPDPLEAARQLYREHPHILKEDKIPIGKVADLVAKIQQQLQLDDEDDYEGEEFEESGDKDYAPAPPVPEPPKEEKKSRPRPKFLNNEFQDDGPLNRSM